MNRPTGSGGFSLTEVLVAFVIVSFSLMVVFQIIGRNARAQALVGDYEQALLIADGLLSQGPEPSWQWGESRGQHGRFDWQLSVQPPAAQTGPLDWGNPSQGAANTQLVNIKVTVGWQQGGQRHQGNREISLQTLRILSADDAR